MGFEVGSAAAGEAGPVVFVGDAKLFVVGWLAVLIGHFEEDEVGELFEVVAVADSVVAKGVAEAPDFGDDRVGGHNRSCAS